MDEIETILANIEEIKDTANSRLISAVKISEKAVFVKLNSMLKNLTTKAGILEMDSTSKKLLLQISKVINQTLELSGYGVAVNKFVLDFEKIDKNIELLHKSANNLKVDMRKLTQIQKGEILNTIDNLLGSGVDTNFINPIKKSLYRHISVGGSIADAEKILSNYLIETDKNIPALSRYVGQVSTDSINQYEGAMNNQIAVEYDLNDIMYIGSLIKDSRPQCRRWVGMKKIKGNDLQKEINWAEKNGSGMIKGTTSETFRINRGGYNCRHTAIPVFAE